MNTITLDNILPRVFEGEPLSASDVWHRELIFHRGESYIIEAPSGTGKSSLCAFIYGNRRDFSGKILFDGTDIASITPNQWQELRRTQLAYLPQELDLFPELTALENIQLKNSLTNHIPAARIDQWLEMLGIADRRSFPVGKMSIGQQQRVAIIRTICQPFSFLLIDEPVSHLDAENNALAARIIQEEASRQGASIIATSVGNRIGINANHCLNL